MVLQVVLVQEVVAAKSDDVDENHLCDFLNLSGSWINRRVFRHKEEMRRHESSVLCLYRECVKGGCECDMHNHDQAHGITEKRRNQSTLDALLC